MDSINAYTRNLRYDFQKSGLEETDVPTNPFQLFGLWYAEAVESKLREPNAMTLMTSGKSGKPTGRIVLLKEFHPHHFLFFTNYESKKGEDLLFNSNAALLFYWQSMERQVRIEGRVQKTSSEISNVYFSERPRESQIGAWASAQSKVLKSRVELEEKVKKLDEEYKGKTIPRPPHWGGFDLEADYYEFWQGRPGRLHDRFSFTKKSDGSWARERLSP